MRPSVWVTLLVLVVLAAGIRTHSSSVRASSKGSTKAVNTSQVVLTNSWIVEGTWKDLREDAIASAFQEAEAKVGAYLRARDPQLVWLPTADYIRERLWKDLGLEEVTEKPVGNRRSIQQNNRLLVEEEKSFPDQLGTMRKAYVKVVVSSEDLGAIKRMDSEYRQKQRQLLAQHRQLFLAKVVAVVVAVLAALVGYFRLEEATKGYYTAWLRLAVVSLLAAVVLGLLFVA